MQNENTERLKGFELVVSADCWQTKYKIETETNKEKPSKFHISANCAIRTFDLVFLFSYHAMAQYKRHKNVIIGKKV